MAEDKSKKHITKGSLWFGAGLALLFTGMWWFHAFQGLENRWQDRMHQWRGMRRADPRVLLVTIDDRSISEIGQYPWPRSTYAPLILNLKKHGAKVIGFDVLYIDPSRPEEDKALIDATRKAGNVIHAADIDSEMLATHLNTWVFREAIEPLKNASAGIGLVNVGLTVDKDGAVRRVQLMQGTLREPVGLERILEDEGRIPLFGVKILSLYEGKAPEEYAKEHGLQILLNVAGQYSWEEPHPSGAIVDGAPLMVVKTDFAFRRIAAIDVIRDELTDEDRKALDGAMVLVGFTATGAYDHYPSPFNELTPGVEVHANTIDNLLQKNYLTRLPLWLDLLCIWGMVALAIYLMTLSPLSGSLCTLGLGGAWAGLNYAIFMRELRIDFIAPVAALATCYVVLLVQRVLHEQKEKRWIKGTFGQYLSPKVVEVLVNDPSKLRLGGDKRDLSVFFLDIAHFTTISEKLTPEELTHFLNRYLTALSNVILKNDGVIDKYIGDCIMAFWNAPLDQPRHRELACISAIECIEAVRKLNAEALPADFPEKPAIRVGLNAGDAVVGNMGSETRLSYTVIGDNVNLASRLEGANKFFGSDIMASEMIFEPVKDKFEARCLGSVRVVGKAIPIKVYELWGTKGSLDPERSKALALFNSAQEAYLARRFEEAAKGFTEMLEIKPDDKCAKLYLSQANDFALLPPQDDWDGVFNLTSK